MAKAKKKTPAAPKPPSVDPYARLNEFTNVIAVEYQRMLDEIMMGNVSDQTKNEARVNIVRLQQLGADPANPIPGN